MDLAKYAVTAVLVEKRSVRSVAASTGRSKSWVHRHVQLYREGGEAALEPKKPGPKSGPKQTAPEVEDAIVAWRKQLSERGWDAGAKTIQWHLHQDGLAAPALITIHRVLRRRGFITPQPQKRPRSSWIRFESALPNETWQTDMTHWQLENDEGVEIINFIDDYSRAVLCSSVVKVALAADVVRLFFATTEIYGLPASVLSDIQRGHLHRGLPGLSHGHGDRTGPTGHPLQTRQALPPSDPRKSRALPPDVEKVVAQAAGRGHHRRTASPDRRLREVLQRTTSTPGEELPTDARVAHPRQSHARDRRPTVAGQDPSAPRSRRPLGIGHLALSPQTPSHQCRTSAPTQARHHLDGRSRRSSG